MDQTIQSIFDFCYTLWVTISYGATYLWRFFGSEVDSTVIEYLGLPDGTTYVELMFGGVLMFVLITLLFKALASIFPGS